MRRNLRVPSPFGCRDSAPARPQRDRASIERGNGRPPLLPPAPTGSFRAERPRYAGSCLARLPEAYILLACGSLGACREGVWSWPGDPVFSGRDG